MTKKKSERILPSKAKRTKKTSKKTAKQNMSLYSSLSYKHRAKKEANARRRAEDLAKLQKSQSSVSLLDFTPREYLNGGFLGVGKKQSLSFLLHLS